MKILISTLLAAGMAIGTASAAEMSATEKMLVDQETTWNKVYMAKDVKGMDALLGDEWTGQDDSGKLMTKAAFMASFKAGDMTATSIVNHDVTARVKGTIAIVQGGDTEKSAYKGKDTSGTYSWTDILENKGGKWVSIASQVTKVKAPMK